MLGQIVTLLLPAITAAAQSGDLSIGGIISQAIAGGAGVVAGLVGIEGGVVSGVMNLESSGVRASDWRPRHDKCYHEA